MKNVGKKRFLVTLLKSSVCFFFKMLIIFRYTLNSFKFFSDISGKQDSDEGVCSRI